VSAVERVVADPAHLSDARRAVAAELFHGPGHATDRALHELYAAIELDAPAHVQPVAPVDAPIRRAERVLAR
jgi:hypothetical protein